MARIMHLRLPLSSRLLSLLLTLALLPLALAARPVRSGAVTAELVAADASIQPGRPFWVALQMDHDEHWHSYWINPGTGFPTSLVWTLPPGFTAGPIQWPAPHVVRDTAGRVTGNGYEGRNFLFVQITPPADLPVGTSVTLAAVAEWLMCQDVCMPGDASLALTLPVVAEPPTANAVVAEEFHHAFAELPVATKDWYFTAQRAGDRITLRISRAAGNPRRPVEPHYFDERGVVDYAAPQVVSDDGEVLTLTLAVSPDAPAEAPGLQGVLTAKGGLTSGAVRGVRVDEPFVVREPVIAGGGASATPAAAGPAPAGLAATLLLALLGGLVLNLMPCVFPVLGIKIMGFVNQAGHDRAKVMQHGLAFAAGVLLSFWALAGLLLALRAGGSQLGWGFQLQSSAFVFGMVAFLLVFALNLSGLFEVGLAATGVGAGLQSKEGLTGSLFTGALATLVATPCSAPFLAPALGAALALPAFASLLVFTAIATGLALPYLLLSLFPQAIKLLPRPGAWMETFKQFMAFPLYATVGWLLWVLAGQTADDDNALLKIMLGLVLVAMAAWAYGRFGQAFGKPRRQWFGRVAALALVVGGLWFGWPREAAAATGAGTTAGYQVVWEKWSPEAVAAARAAGKFVYVDFTARWCATCQSNKLAVFHDDAVLAEFARRSVVLLRGDWTNRDPKITVELARWNRSAVPFNLIYAPGAATEPVVLPELLTGGKVLAALAAAAGR